MQSLLRGLSRGASRGADLASTSVSQAGRQRIHKVGHRGRTGGLCPCSTAGSSWPHPFTVTAAKGKPQTALPWLYFPSSLSLNEEIKLLHTLFKKHILISPEKRRYRVFYPPHGEYTCTWHLPNVSFSDWHTVWWAISPLTLLFWLTPGVAQFPFWQPIIKSFSLSAVRFFSPILQHRKDISFCSFYFL